MTRINPPIFALAAIVSTLLPVIIGAMRYGFIEKEVRPYFWLLAISAISTLTQVGLAMFSIVNLWTLHVYLLFELPVAVYAYSIWTKEVPARIILRAVGAGYIIFWVLAKTMFESPLGPATYSAPVSRILLVVSSIYTLYHVASETERSLLEDSKFWLLGTSIVFASGSAMFAALQGMIGQQVPDMIIRVYNIYWSFLVFINLGYSWAFLCKPTPLTSGGR